MDLEDPKSPAACGRGRGKNSPARPRISRSLRPIRSVNRPGPVKPRGGAAPGRGSADPSDRTRLVRRRGPIGWLRSDRSERSWPTGKGPWLMPDVGSAGEGHRVLRRSALWFSEGTARKAEARRSRRCVECQGVLPDGRSPYCGRVCRWRFQGRYFWDAARIYVMHRDRYTCQRCRVRHRARELEVDHIREIAAGGASLEYANLQTLCRRCHRSKTVRFLRHRAVERGNRPRRSEPRGEPAADAGDWFPA